MKLLDAVKAGNLGDTAMLVGYNSIDKLREAYEWARDRHKYDMQDMIARFIVGRTLYGERLGQHRRDVWHIMLELNSEEEAHMLMLSLAGSIATVRAEGDLKICYRLRNRITRLMKRME